MRVAVFILFVTGWLIDRFESICTLILCFLVAGKIGIRLRFRGVKMKGEK